MELDCYRGGSGPPLVLLRGIWDGRHSWSPVLDRLAAEREVLALTLPDHLGSSPLPAGTAPSVEAWMDAVEVELDAAAFGPAHARVTGHGPLSLPMQLSGAHR